MKLKKILNIFKIINFQDTFNEISSCDVLFFCHDVNRGVTLGNKAYSPLIDSVRQELEQKGYKCLTIANPWSKMIGEVAYGRPIAINRSYFISKVVKKILGIRADLKLYKNILKLAEPKLIITIGCNNELCEAAHSLNVYHIELLHGIGYTSIPWGWGKAQKSHLPQGIFSLDKISTTTFKQLENLNIDIKQIKHPFLSRFIKEETNLLPAEWVLKKSKKKYKKEILISLQWGYASQIDEIEIFEGYLKNGLFYEELEEIIQETKETVLWRFRFHPVQYRQPEKYKKLLDYMDNFIARNPNCEWKESTYLPLPAILKNCSGHLTMSSMSSYEAAYMGVPTLALCPSLQNGIYGDCFEDLVESRYLEKQKFNVEKVKHWLWSCKVKEPFLGFSDLIILEEIEKLL
ncbi:hypothetical protein IS511_07975 [Acinetobacter towneri]|uniref:hypothetical protein n=1 Tax=Acinetobacter towneri TaxID=202956 RepID=UPI001889C97F|nr:hypothetical protein [Acinetobacter towneri]MBF4521108.1 hypothetical protein [Acinetobacter towneri]